MKLYLETEEYEVPKASLSGYVIGNEDADRASVVEHVRYNFELMLDEIGDDHEPGDWATNDVWEIEYEGDPREALEEAYEAFDAFGCEMPYKRVFSLGARFTENETEIEEFAAE